MLLISYLQKEKSRRNSIWMAVWLFPERWRSANCLTKGDKSFFYWSFRMWKSARGWKKENKKKKLIIIRRIQTAKNSFWFNILHLRFSDDSLAKVIRRARSRVIAQLIPSLAGQTFNVSSPSKLFHYISVSDFDVCNFLLHTFLPLSFSQGRGRYHQTWTHPSCGNSPLFCWPS